MPSPRLLVIEGNSPATMAEHVSYGGTVASRNYGDLLRDLLPGVEVDVCFPADTAAVLPVGAALEGYDGIAITGSSLHVYKGGPEVTLVPGQTFYEGPDDIHTVGRNASATKPAKFVVVLVKNRGADVVLPVN